MTSERSPTPFAIGDPRWIRFRSIGETSYMLKVRFADGSEMVGKEHSAESGYEFREKVGDSGIESESSVLNFFGGR